MKINLNPLAQLVKRAERRVNFHRTPTAQDAAHDRKRQLAQAVRDGAAATPAFAAAAAIEGVTPIVLAAIILAKPDVLMAADNVRRALIVAIRAAKTPAEIDRILSEAGIPRHPADSLPDPLP